MIDPTASPSGAARTLSPLAERIVALLPDVPPDVRPGRAQLADVVAAIAERFRPARIVLFGSRAYGTPTYDSDVDLMVIMDTPLRNPEQAHLIRRTLDLRPSFALDILVRRPDQIALGLAEGDFFIEDVISKGITLYGSGSEGAPMTSPTGGANSSRQSNQEAPSLSTATQSWLDKADEDLRSAKRLIEPPAMYATACFHAQQSAEKDLKAYLQQRGVRFPRTHELAALARLVDPTLPIAAPLRVDLDWLTDFAVDVRYPGVGAGQAECSRAIGIAEQVKALIRTTLGLAV